MRRVRQQPLAAVGTLGALAIVVIAAAATTGSWALQERHYGSLHWNPRPARPSPVPTLTPGPPQRPGSARAWGILQFDPRWIGYPLLLLLAAVLAIVLWRVWQRYRRTAGVDAPGAVPGDGVLLATEATPHLPPLLAGVARAQRSLRGAASSEDAIIAAWLAVEQGAQASGVQRHPAQTPTEFTVAVLASTGADPAAIEGLRDLYLRARFSAHPTGSAQIAAAAGHLSALEASWRSEPSAAGTGG